MARVDGCTLGGRVRKSPSSATTCIQAMCVTHCPQRQRCPHSPKDSLELLSTSRQSSGAGSLRQSPGLRSAAAVRVAGKLTPDQVRRLNHRWVLRVERVRQKPRRGGGQCPRKPRSGCSPHAASFTGAPSILVVGRHARMCEALARRSRISRCSARGSRRTDWDFPGHFDRRIIFRARLTGL